MVSCRHRLLEHLLMAIVVYQITHWSHMMAPMRNNLHCEQDHIPLSSSSLSSSCVGGGGGGGDTARSKHPSNHPTSKVGQSARGKLPTKKGTTFLLGIFCQRNDTQHRQLSRSTMLGKSVLPHSVYSRICTLQEFLKMTDSVCQIIYTFVVGGGGGGGTNASSYEYPSDIMNRPDFQHLVSNDPLTKIEPDVLLLNIQENMNHGKTPSWFYYASTIVNQGIDYVAKLDLDTLVSIPQLLSFLQQELRPRPTPSDTQAPPRVYGGILMDFEACGGKYWPTRCFPAKGKIYMSGQFYFLSYDLVEYTAQWRTNHSFKERKFEDLSFAMRIWSYPHPLHLIAFNPHIIWTHGSKNESLWRKDFERLQQSGWNISSTYFASGLFKELPTP
jgi:Galactosyltransferase